MTDRITRDNIPISELALWDENARFLNHTAPFHSIK